jgi:molybdopterin-guanine dinucleotide biosynthesis protein A
LLGAWRRQPCRIALAASFAGGERAVHRALSGLRVVEVEFGDDRVLHNANRPDDLPR